jgi:hypothetical protein
MNLKNLKSTRTKDKKFNLYCWQHKGVIVYLTKGYEKLLGADDLDHLDSGSK